MSTSRRRRSGFPSGNVRVSAFHVPGQADSELQRSSDVLRYSQANLAEARCIELCLWDEL